MVADTPYIPSEESLKFISFIRAAGIEDNANAAIHYRLADKYFSDDKQIVVEAFRGSAKSSLMEWFIIYTAAMGELPGFGYVGFIAFVGDSMENGVKNAMRNIAVKIERSEFLQKLIKINRKTDSEIELVNLDGTELYIKGYGGSSNVRGVRYKGLRPSVVIMDDVTSTEAGESETMMKAIEENFFKSIMPALHPTKYKVFYIATPVSERDLLHKLVQNPEWSVHRFPICEKYPCSKEEFVGNWEDRFPYEAVRARYEMFAAAGKTQAFYQEYMMIVTDLSTLLVDEDDIKWFDPSIVHKQKEAYNFYIATDFATSTKKSADYSCITVWAINNNNDWMLVDGQARRQTMQENIEDVFRYVKRWKPLSVGIETSGQQGGFLSILDEEMLRRNQYFTLAKKQGSKEPGIRPTKDKVHRFVTGVQPKFQQKKIWLPKPEICAKTSPALFEAVNELVHELSRFTLAGGVKALQHDDMIDTLNQLSEMEKYAPGDDVEANELTDVKRSDIWGDLDDESGFEGNKSTIF
jgi:hypothetical protein